jgi:flagellar biosynthetic protein FliQ
MTIDQAATLVANLFRTMLLVVGPVLGAALVAGIFVGVVQTATQINDASISFLVKLAALTLIGVLLGPHLVSYILDYTRASFGGITQVVR